MIQLGWIKILRWQFCSYSMSTTQTCRCCKKRDFWLSSSRLVVWLTFSMMLRWLIWSCIGAQVQTYKVHLSLLLDWDFAFWVLLISEMKCKKSWRHRKKKVMKKKRKKLPTTRWLKVRIKMVKTVKRLQVKMKIQGLLVVPRKLKLTLTICGMSWSIALLCRKLTFSWSFLSMQPRSWNMCTTLTPTINLNKSQKLKITTILVISSYSTTHACS